MNRMYFVDFENVGDNGLDGYFDLLAEDIVTVFYTEKAGKISIDFVNLMDRCTERARLIFIKVQAGKQALDLQLSTYLGAIISKYGEGSEYIIVSKDKGYGNVINFWTEINNNFKITQQSKIAQNITELLDSVNESTKRQPKKIATEKSLIAKPTSEDRQSYNNLILKTLSKADKFDSSEIGKATSIAMKAMGSPYVKRDVYQNLIKQIGRKKGTAIYNVIKPILK